MTNNTLGRYKTAQELVAAKLAQFRSLPHQFDTMFELMFSEKYNILYEKSIGYRIETVTYGAAYDRIVKTAAWLSNRLSDLAPDSVVGLYMDNSVEWLIAFWAILKAGFRPLLLNTRLSHDILSRVMQRADTAALVAQSGAPSGFRTIATDDLLAVSDAETNAAALSDGRPFGSELFVMSSGTTDEPKLCAYSAEEFYYQISDSLPIITRCKQMAKHYEGHLKLLTFLPFYHIFGLVAVYIWFSFFSRTLVHLQDFSPNCILSTIRRHKVTHLFAVPLFWNEVYRQAQDTIIRRGEATAARFERALKIAKHIGDVPLIGSLFIRLAFREVRDNLFGDSICFMISGGSDIRPEVLSFFNYIGYHLANGYGMSEVGITSVELSSSRALRSRGYIGQPLSSIGYRLSDEGHLLIHGTSCARYVCQNGRSIPRPDWFDTRDLAVCEKGHYRLLGRSDDLIVAENGENLNPCLVEPLLAGDGYTLALVGQTGAGGIMVPTLLIYAEKAGHDSCQRIRETIGQKLRDHQLTSTIGRLLFVREPLMLPNEFKLNRTRLSHALADGCLPLLSFDKQEYGQQMETDCLPAVRDLFAAVLEKDPTLIGADSDFFLDEGGTSLDYLALVTRLQEDYALSIPSVQDQPLTTVRTISRYILEREPDTAVSRSQE